MDDGTVHEFTTQPISVIVCTVCEMRTNIILVSDERRNLTERLLAWILMVWNIVTRRKME
jgi:hypothetical protein